MGEARAVVESFYAAFNAGDMNATRPYFDSNVVTVEPSGGEMRGLDAFEGYLGVFNRAVPDARLNALGTIEEGEFVAIEGTYTGTHTGPLASPQGDIPPSGRTFVLPYMEAFQVRAGRIVSHHVFYDQMSFLGQLGLMPPSA